MIDHITIAVSDLERSKLFYERVFEPLGYRLSFGKEGVFWAFDVGGSLFEIQHTDDKPPLTRVHVAFRVQSRAEVETFYRAAFEADAGDNGAPGPRPQYSENYYACFVLDPDEYNIEAMIDAPATPASSTAIPQMPDA
ncbi:VOC family protein [Rhizobium leguminosarum]|uniref:VOC family protein n=1 Tax=Rhizobium leguminosarum TaxID=384 RepID=UPI0010311AC0|nr:VOC family protein [Rhizobium leguminosarum]TAU89478.1 VOC family protein [Rhizobium leguminosarum]TAV54131.1 VOC family protein [Rhizobium leguminosarum]